MIKRARKKVMKGQVGTRDEHKGRELRLRTRGTAGRYGIGKSTGGRTAYIVADDK
jgi:predicted alpha/beta-hydrolase family hydrolase